jgi:hypothetical protein
MWIFDIFTLTIVIAAWVFMFFVFDELILKGYFKKKLQRRFKVEE